MSEKVIRRVREEVEEVSERERERKEKLEKEGRGNGHEVAKEIRKGEMEKIGKD